MSNFPEDIVREMNSGKKAIESTYQDDGNLQKPKKQKKNAYTTIKVSKEYKELFDVLALKAFSKRIEFIEEIIESWEKNNGEQEILEMFAKGQLSTRRR
jgi:predicted DNA-binding ArsR family transcriptional regulator